MSKNDRRRQRKLEKKLVQRSEKKKTQLQKQSGGMPAHYEEVAKYAHAPLVECRMGLNLNEQGIRTVTIARKASPGCVALASFLVDTYCLGVKDCFAQIISVEQYEEAKCGMEEVESFEVVAPAKARKFIEDAGKYSTELHLLPPRVYSFTRVIFGAIDASDCLETFEFGKDGKPFFVSGPYDTPARCEQIRLALVSSVGQGNFEFLQLFDFRSGVSAGAFNRDDFDEYDFDEEGEDDFEEEDAAEAEIATGEETLQGPHVAFENESHAAKLSKLAEIFASTRKLE